MYKYSICKKLIMLKKTIIVQSLKLSYDKAGQGDPLRMPGAVSLDVQVV